MTASMARAAAVSSRLKRCPLYAKRDVRASVAQAPGDQDDIEPGSDQRRGMGRIERSLEETREGLRFKAPKTANGVWRRALKLTMGSLSDLQADRHSQLSWSGRLGEPSTSPNSSVSAFGLPRPSASRVSSSFCRCSRSTASRARSLRATLRPVISPPHGGPIQVHVRQPKGKQLSPPGSVASSFVRHTEGEVSLTHTGRQVDDGNLIERVSGQLIYDKVDLVLGEDLDLLLRHLRWLAARSCVCR
jgi:hypothetical protein